MFSLLSGEATNTHLIVFDLTRPGLEPSIYRTRGEHANHYTTDAVFYTRIQNTEYIILIHETTGKKQRLVGSESE
jgi:hypothetical protein